MWCAKVSIFIDILWLLWQKPFSRGFPDPLQLKIIGPINKFSTIRLNWDDIWCRFQLTNVVVLKKYIKFEFNIFFKTTIFSLFPAREQNPFPVHATASPSTTVDGRQVLNVDG